MRGERRDYGEAVLAQRVRDALARLNPSLPIEALEDTFRKLTRPEGADLIQRNRALHRLIVDGVTVEYRNAERGARVVQAVADDSRGGVGEGDGAGTSGGSLRRMGAHVCRHNFGGVTGPTLMG